MADVSGLVAVPGAGVAAGGVVALGDALGDELGVVELGELMDPAEVSVVAAG